MICGLGIWVHMAQVFLIRMSAGGHHLKAKLGENPFPSSFTQMFIGWGLVGFQIETTIPCHVGLSQGSLQCGGWLPSDSEKESEKKWSKMEYNFLKNLIRRNIPFPLLYTFHYKPFTIPKEKGLHKSMTTRKRGSLVKTACHTWR